MELVKSMKAVYPTVTYGKVEVFTSVKLTEGDLPAEVGSLPLDQRHKYMDEWLTALLCRGFAQEYQQIHDNIADRYLTTVVPVQVEQRWIAQGRLKP